MKPLLLGFFLVVIVGASAAAYFLLTPAVGVDISMEFTSPGEVLAGQPFDLEVGFANKSDRAASNAKISVALPAGVIAIGKSPDTRVVEEAIGDIGPGSVEKKTYRLIVTSGADTIKHLEGKIIYATGASTRVQYEKKSAIDIIVGRSAMILNLSAPEKVFSGETFEMKISYENTSGVSYDNLIFKAEYPPIFQFRESSRQPSRSNNVWNLGSVPRGGKGNFTISGSVIGSPDSYFNLNGSLSATIGSQSYPLTIQSLNVVVAVSPLSLSLQVNGVTAYTAEAGETLTYKLTYRNNSSVSFENATIGAIVTGDMFDFGNAKTNGFFNSLTNTFIWNTANTPTLRSISPGETGFVLLAVPVRSSYPIKKESDKNFMLKVRAQIESPTVPPGTAAAKTISVTSLDTRVAGALGIDALGFYKEPSAGIENSGPYPPKVNQPTQYTVHWRAAAYAADMANVKVSAYLQSNTSFTGKTKATAGTLRYDPTSGQVIWDLGNLPANRGVVGGLVEAVFQVENTPAINQVGQSVPLLSRTTIQGSDGFTNQSVSADHDDIDTSLPDDKTLVQRSVQ